MRWVNFDGPQSLLNQFADVLITEALPNSLRGRWIETRDSKDETRDTRRETRPNHNPDSDRVSRLVSRVTNA